MPTLTTNYGLKKPLGTESALISVINEDFDAIDDALTPTISDTSSPNSSSVRGKLPTIFGWLANRIKTITGKSNWYTAPATDLETVSKHLGASGASVHPVATTSAAGFMSADDKKTLSNATSENYVSRLIKRDANGRAKIASPSANNDIANKGYVDDTIAASKDVFVDLYVGTGEKYQYIPLDFAPSRVVIQCLDSTAYRAVATPGKNGCTSATYSSISETSSTIVNDYHYITCAISDNGFYVCYCSSNSHAHTNYKGYNYIYHAWK